MALSQTAVRRWYLVHKWSSIVCTGFLLLLCLTGLPLIFHHEIDAVTRPQAAVQAAPGRASPPDLASIVRRAQAEMPGWPMLFLTWDEEKPIINAVLLPSFDRVEPGLVKLLPFDGTSGKRLAVTPPNEGVMAFIFDLHASLLLGLPGTLFLALIGVIFAVAIISGVVVYAPFMRKLPFGTVRKDKSRRLKWLDTHNMLGIVTLAWVSVVGITGLILCLETPIRLIWQSHEMTEVLAPYKGQRPIADPVAPDVAYAAVKARMPEADVSFIAWPGSPFATPHHYLVGLRGDTPLTEHLVTQVMVDAGTGRLTNIREMPWYVSMLFLSGPLHYGDYGGLPLKIIWALLDVAAIVILATGLYLWLGRRRAPVERRGAELRSGGPGAVQVVAAE